MLNLTHEEINEAITNKPVAAAAAMALFHETGDKESVGVILRQYFEATDDSPNPPPPFQILMGALDCIMQLAANLAAQQGVGTVAILTSLLALEVNGAPATL